MTVGIRGTCGWVDAKNDAVYIISGKVTCGTPNGGEQVEVTDFTCARLKDGTFEFGSYTSKDIPSFVLDELDKAYLLELNAYAEMAAAKAEKEANARKTTRRRLTILQKKLPTRMARLTSLPRKE